MWGINIAATLTADLFGTRLFLTQVYLGAPATAAPGAACWCAALSLHQFLCSGSRPGPRARCEKSAAVAAAAGWGAAPTVARPLLVEHREGSTSRRQAAAAGTLLVHVCRHSVSHLTPYPCLYLMQPRQLLTFQHCHLNNQVEIVCTAIKIISGMPALRVLNCKVSLTGRAGKAGRQAVCT